MFLWNEVLSSDLNDVFFPHKEAFKMQRQSQRLWSRMWAGKSFQERLQGMHLSCSHTLIWTLNCRYLNARDVVFPFFPPKDWTYHHPEHGTHDSRHNWDWDRSSAPNVSAAAAAADEAQLGVMFCTCTARLNPRPPTCCWCSEMV